MQDFPTQKRRALPRLANLVTLAALIWITWWSAQQRPAMPDPHTTRVVGAAVGGTVAHQRQILSNQPASNLPATQRSVNETLVSAQPAAPAAAGPVTPVDYRPAPIAAGALR